MTAETSGAGATGDQRPAVASYTPGPWVIFHADEDGPNDILPAMRPGWIARDVKMAADARLIAAAPELLKLLRATTNEAAEHLKNIVDAKAADFGRLSDPKLRDAYEQETARMERLVERARAVIAKAEGR